MTNYIQKFIFDKLPVKGSMVVLNDAWKTIAGQKNYPEGIKQVLGELLAANVMLTSNLKLDGKVICQIQDSPHFDLIVTECSNLLKMRATARFNDLSPDYSDCLEKGRLVVSIDSQGDGQLYQSIIAFNGDTVAEILNNYMTQSEQLQTWFLIAYTEHKVSGFMLQQLPDIHGNFVNEIERLFMLANTLSKHELLHDDLTRIIEKLFHEDDVVIMDAHNIEFACTCSRTRVGEILRNLGKDELEQIIEEDGNIAVNCDYCNTEYHFTQVELEQFVLQLSLEDMEPVSGQIN